MAPRLQLFVLVAAAVVSYTTLASMDVLPSSRRLRSGRSLAAVLLHGSGTEGARRQRGVFEREGPPEVVAGAVHSFVDETPHGLHVVNIVTTDTGDAVWVVDYVAPMKGFVAGERVRWLVSRCMSYEDVVVEGVWVAPLGFSRRCELVEAQDATAARGRTRELGYLTPRRTARVLVLRVGFLDFTGNTVYPSCDEACARERIWGASPVTVASFYDDNLQFSMVESSSTIATVATNLSTFTADCDTYKFTRAAFAAYAGDPSQYTLKVFLLPSGAGGGACGGRSGLGLLSCTEQNCYTWLWTDFVNTWIHEIGHNFGLLHAAVDSNNDGLVDVDTVTGATSEYSDKSDPMGTGSSRFSAVYRNVLGAIPPVNVLTLTNQSSVVLQSSSLPSFSPSSPVLLVIRRASDTFWVSLRTLHTGTYDRNLIVDWANRVYVHRYTPGSTQRMVAKLAAGGSFVDTRNGIDMRVEALDAAGHTARLTFRMCVAAVPPVLAVASEPPLLAYEGFVTQVPIVLSLTNVQYGCTLPSTFIVSVATLPRTWQLDSAGECNQIGVVVVPDNFPREISFRVVNSTGATILSGTPGRYSTTYCGAVGEPLTAVMMDTEGDGFCCEFGRGGYNVTVGGIVVRTGGDFKSTSQSVRFYNSPTRVLPVNPSASVGISSLLSVPDTVPVGTYNVSFLVRTQDAENINATFVLPVQVTAETPPTRTASRSLSASASASLSPVRVFPSRTRSASTSLSSSASRSLSSSPSRSVSALPSRTRVVTSRPRSASPSTSMSASRSSTKLASRTVAGTRSKFPSRTRSASSSASRSFGSSAQQSPSASRSRSSSRSRSTSRRP